MRVLIVGAGIARLSCAQSLVANGHDAVLFDKGRRAGGRMSTRRTSAGDLALQFDHDAQYFTARDPGFVAQVAAWEDRGVAAHWLAAGDDAWVGIPAMDAPLHALAERHRVKWDVRIDRLERDGGTWIAHGSGVAERYDAAVIAVPAEQAAPLLAPHHPAYATLAAAAVSAPCWTAMAAFSRRLPTSQDIMRSVGALGWAARDRAKPGRGAVETWVVQASPDWSRQHLEEAPEDVAPAFLAMLAAALGATLPEPIYLRAHRWRYARSGGGGGGGGGRPSALWDSAIRLGACGD